MTKRFELNHDLTCHELAGYKLPEVERTPIAIEVEMEYYYMSSVKLYGKDAGWVKCDKIQFDGIKESIPTCPLKEIPATNPDGTVKGRWVYE